MNEGLMNIKDVKILTKDELKEFKNTNSNYDAEKEYNIAGFKKNQNDWVIIKGGWDKYRDYPYVDVRIWYSDKETGRKKPGKAGMRMTPAQWALFSVLIKVHSKELGFDQNAENNLNYYLNNETLDAMR